MTYRLEVTNQAGIVRGYQNRDTLDIETFTQIVTGQKPLGDADAQTRDSTAIDSSFTNLPCYYTAVFNDDTNDWVRSADPADIDRLYQECYHDFPLP